MNIQDIIEENDDLMRENRILREERDVARSQCVAREEEVRVLRIELQRIRMEKDTERIMRRP